MKSLYIGRATYKKGKLYFDEVGWQQVKRVAAHQHRSPKAVVIAAVKRYIRKIKNGEKA